MDGPPPGRAKMCMTKCNERTCRGRWAVAGIVQILAMFAAGLLTAERLLRLIRTPESILDDSALYLRIFCVGIPGMALYNAGTGILRVAKGPVGFQVIFR